MRIDHPVEQFVQGGHHPGGGLVGPLEAGQGDGLFIEGDAAGLLAQLGQGLGDGLLGIGVELGLLAVAAQPGDQGGVELAHGGGVAVHDQGVLQGGDLAGDGAIAGLIGTAGGGDPALVGQDIGVDGDVGGRGAGEEIAAGAVIEAEAGAVESVDLADEGGGQAVEAGENLGQEAVADLEQAADLASRGEQGGAVGPDDGQKVAVHGVGLGLEAVDALAGGAEDQGPAADRDLDRAVGLGHHLDADQSGQLFDEPVALVLEIVGLLAAGLNLDDLAIEVGDLAGQGVDAVDQGADLGVEVQAGLDDLGPGALEGAGQRDRLLAQGQAGGRIVGLVGQGAPGVPEAGEEGAQAVVGGFGEDDLDLAQLVGDGLPALLLLLAVPDPAVEQAVADAADGGDQDAGAELAGPWRAQTAGCGEGSAGGEVDHLA